MPAELRSLERQDGLLDDDHHDDHLLETL